MIEADLSSARRFLDALGGPHTFQVFPEGETDAYPHGWAPHGTLDDVAEALVQANRDLCGISVLVNLTDGKGRSRDNIVEPRAVFIDIDEVDEDGERKPIPDFGKGRWPSAGVRTRRGYHCYWWLKPGEEDWERWEKVQAAMARRWHGDPHMVDRTKCLRIPGLWHHKQDPPVQMMLSYIGDRRWTLDEIVEAFKLRLDEPQPPRPTTPTVGRPTWALQAIASMTQPERVEQYASWATEQPPAVSGSGGHSQLLKVIKMAYNYGVDWSSAWAVVDRYNDGCNPPWDARQLRTQFDSASRSRFSPENWESRLWAPEPPVVTREGARPEPPPIGMRELPPPPEEPPFPDDDEYRGDPPGPADAGQEPPGGGGGGRKVRGGGDDEGGGRRRRTSQILNKNAPLETARTFVRERYVDSDVRTLRAFRRGWYGWSGGERYEYFSKERINHELYDFSAKARTYGPEDKSGNRQLVPFNPTASKVNDMRHALESLVFVNDTLQPPCWIGTARAKRPDPRELVACANGLLHLPTGEFLGKRPDYFNLTALGVDYDADAPEPVRWLRFLEDLWPDDRESHYLLQEWFGLCLVPDTSYQKALMIVGPKRSGKGTIARILNALHGEQNSVAWPSLTDLVSRFGMQGLVDKTVAIMPDLRVSGRLDTQQAIERFLQITGEDWVQVDRKNLPMLQAQIPVRFLLLSNLPPRLPDAGGAFASRVMALRLEQSFFGREDRHLTDKIATELPGILQWSIEGWKRLRERGSFHQPRTGAELLEELAHLSNPLQAFIEERCEFGAEYETYTNEMFLQWRKWCEDEGRSAVGEKSTFVRNMRAACPQLRTTRPRNPAGKRMRAIAGVRLKYDAPPEQQTVPGVTPK